MTVVVPGRLPGSAPWRAPHLLLLAVTTGGGLLLVMASWVGASGSVELGHQVAWSNVGAAGVIVLGTGNVVWFLAGRRAVGELRRAMLANLRRDLGDANDVAAPATELVASESMARYHRAGCPLATGKSTVRASESEHRTAGRKPCGVCLGRPSTAEPALSAS